MVCVCVWCDEYQVLIIDCAPGQSLLSMIALFSELPADVQCARRHLGQQKTQHSRLRCQVILPLGRTSLLSTTTLQSLTFETSR